MYNNEKRSKKQKKKKKQKPNKNKNENWKEERQRKRGRIIKGDARRGKILSKIRVKIVLFFVDAAYVFQFLS